MKRKFVCGIFAVCLALSVAGCGKESEEQQAANYYQNELGLDREDAEDLAHELYGEDEDEEGEAAGQAGDATEQSSEEKEVEPLPELVNSEWYEQKVQIYDMVFDTYMTAEDIRKIVEGSAYDVELVDAFDSDGNVVPGHLEMDGIWIASFNGGPWVPEAAIEYGLANEEDYSEYNSGSKTYDNPNLFRVQYGNSFMGKNWYDKATLELEGLKTRDDVLAYLSEAGFVEVEKEQRPYAPGSKDRITTQDVLQPAEFADVPHYYCEGVQEITFYRPYKLSETDQAVEYNYKHYSGACLYLVNYMTFTFDTDGTMKNGNIDSGGNISYGYCSPTQKNCLADRQFVILDNMK